MVDLTHRQKITKPPHHPNPGGFDVAYLNRPIVDDVMKTLRKWWLVDNVVRSEGGFLIYKPKFIDLLCIWLAIDVHISSHEPPIQVA